MVVWWGTVALSAWLFDRGRKGGRYGEICGGGRGGGRAGWRERMGESGLAVG